MDCLSLLFTGALDCVGSYGVVMARRTLSAINSQISEMRKQVEVATLQARAMQEQITEMSKQTDTLERSVGVAGHLGKLTLLAYKS
jgi:hypothetical protein